MVCQVVLSGGMSGELSGGLSGGLSGELSGKLSGELSDDMLSDLTSGGGKVGVGASKFSKLLFLLPLWLSVLNIR